MRSIILDGSDDWPPTVFEGAIHIISRKEENDHSNICIYRCLKPYIFPGI